MIKRIPVIILLTLLISLALLARENSSGKSQNISMYKPQVNSDIWLDVNRLSGIFRNNGIWHFDVVANTQGTEWPKGSGNSPIYAGGQWIGAIVDGDIRVAGIQHSATEYQPGMVLSPGVADNPKDPKYQWYVLRSSGSDDRTRWPVDQGAPVDENGDPQLLGDMTIFSVWNDLADHAQYGTNKLSVEVQQTAFAFNRADALGDMQFIRWRMVNKSGQMWDSTYFAIWLDPDLGDASDDLVGCDTLRGLGFTYNATNSDQTYGTPPPAQGIDFFQGPIIDEVGSEVVLNDGTVLTDKKMLKMTSFVFYDNNDSPSGNPDDGHDVWGYMTGFWKDDLPITYGERGRTGTVPTKFMFPGDPETEQTTGWLDYNADDRRFLMTTGPFPMEAWVDANGNGIPDFGEPGVQDIVAAVILARGDNNLHSVTKLKEVDELAQLAYNLNFNLAKAPLPPVVNKSEEANQVVLTWNETSEFNVDGTPYASEDPIVVAALGDVVIIDNVEKVIDDADYNFYGYSVYQYSDASGRDPVLIDHWDIGGTKEASPYTGKRYSIISVNKNPVVGNSGTPLVNGKDYYFGVVAEAYLEFGAPVIFTSPPTIVTVTPGYATGSRVTATYNDTLMVAHNQVDVNLPMSDGSALAWVVDPVSVTGHDYRVIFNNDNDGNPVWHLMDMTLGDTLLKNQSNQRGDDAYTVVDGLLIKVMGPAAGVHGMWQVANGDGPIDGWETENADEDIFWVHWAFNEAADYPTEQTGGGWFFVTWGGGTANDEESFVERVFRGSNWSHAAANVFEMRFTAGTHYAYQRFDDETIVEVPFELWNMGPNPSNTADDYRMLPAILNSDANTGFSFSGDDEASSASNDPMSDWIYWGDPDDRSPGEAGYNSFFSVGVGNVPTENWTEVLARTTLMNWNAYASSPDSVLLTAFPHDTSAWDAADTTFMLDRGWFLDDVNSVGQVTFANGYAYATILHQPEEGTIIRWITNKPNTQNDYYDLTSPAASTITTAYLKSDMQKIKVVPNPYYGYHSGELDPFDRWVQFTFLPAKCTVRIFDLAGNLIRKLEKNDATTPFLRWDMKNEYELPVASGIYIYHVDASGIGEKVGKIAVFAPNERLDTY
jgi:hypothetical protein